MGLRLMGKEYIVESPASSRSLLLASPPGELKSVNHHLLPIFYQNKRLS